MGLAIVIHTIQVKFFSPTKKFSCLNGNSSEKELRVKDWKCPYIMVGDFIENPTADILPLIERSSRSMFFYFRLDFRGTFKNEEKRFEGNQENQKHDLSQLSREGKRIKGKRNIRKREFR